jgi:hypothetical protein
MGRTYTITRNNVSPKVANDLLTIIAPANKSIRILHITAWGEATSSTAMRTVIQRSTGGTTGGGAATPEKLNTSDPAAGLTAYTTWSAQPTLSGSPLFNRSWNAFGGGFDLPLEDKPIHLVNSEQLSIRNTVGTGLMSLEVVVEEL